MPTASSGHVLERFLDPAGPGTDYFETPSFHVPAAFQALLFR